MENEDFEDFESNSAFKYANASAKDIQELNKISSAGLTKYFDSDEFEDYCADEPLSENHEDAAEDDLACPEVDDERFTYLPSYGANISPYRSAARNQSAIKHSYNWLADFQTARSASQTAKQTAKISLKTEDVIFIEDPNVAKREQRFCALRDLAVAKKAIESALESLKKLKIDKDIECASFIQSEIAYLEAGISINQQALPL